MAAAEPEQAGACGGFGSILKQEGLEDLQGAGSFIFLPLSNEELANVSIPEGLYICMYKYGMPYDNTHAKWLLHWLEENGYEAAGDVVDVCLLDTTFYKQNKTKADFCMLQIPVTKK